MHTAGVVGVLFQLTDVQIAGIAISRRIPIATRDIRDFEDLGVKLINPWDAQA